MKEHNFIHQEFDASPDDVIEVVLDNPANVQLLDEANFNRYRNTMTYQYYGGYAERSPFRLRPPGPGHWHLVIDLGGGFGRVRAWIKVISASDEVLST